MINLYIPFPVFKLTAVDSTVHLSQNLFCADVRFFDLIRFELIVLNFFK
jgi:hypothetical protein